MLCQCVTHDSLRTTPTLKNDSAVVAVAVLGLDRTTETEYKEGFNGELYKVVLDLRNILT